MIFRFQSCSLKSFLAAVLLLVRLGSAVGQGDSIGEMDSTKAEKSVDTAISLPLVAPIEQPKLELEEFELPKVKFGELKIAGLKPFVLRKPVFFRMKYFGFTDSLSSLEYTDSIVLRDTSWILRRQKEYPRKFYPIYSIETVPKDSLGKVDLTHTIIPIVGIKLEKNYIKHLIMGSNVYSSCNAEVYNSHIDEWEIDMRTIYGWSIYLDKYSGLAGAKGVKSKNNVIGELRLWVRSTLSRIDTFYTSLNGPVVHFFLRDSINRVLLGNDAFGDNYNATSDDSLKILLKFDSCYIRKLELLDFAFDKNLVVSIGETTQIDTVELRGRYNDTICKLDRFLPPGADGKSCVLTFKKPINRYLVFNYRFFKLDPASVEACYLEDRDAVEFMYENLIEMQRKHGYISGQQQLEIERNELLLKHDGSFQLFFSKHWWNYGYDKGRIFKWTMGLFFLFFFINMILGNYFYQNVYAIKSLEQLFESMSSESFWRGASFYFFGTLLYSMLVFFGIKLDINNFRVNRSIRSVAAAIYLYTFYIIGIVCLVFIANYILLK